MNPEIEGTEVLRGAISGGTYREADGIWLVEIRVSRAPKCVQIGAPALVVLKTEPMPELKK